MQSDSVNDSIYDGGGIYQARFNDKPINSDERSQASLNVEETQEATFHSVDHNSTGNPIGSKQRGLLSLSEQKFNDILDALNQQVEELNRLRQASDVQIKQRQSDERDANEIYQKLFSKNLCTVPNVEHKQSLPSNSDRRSLSSHHVEKNSSSNKCDCQFHFGPSELKLLNELNEYYRKSCQSKKSAAFDAEPSRGLGELISELQVTEEASNFVDCEREISAPQLDCSSHRACLRCASHSDDGRCIRLASGEPQLQQQEPANLNTHSRARLFIDSRSLHSNDENQSRLIATRRIENQLRFSRSEGEIFALWNRRTVSETSTCYTGESEGEVDADPSASTPAASLSSLCHCAVHSREQSAYATSEFLLSNSYESDPECEHPSALIGVEESPSREAEIIERSQNKFKRKVRSPRLPPKRFRRLSSSSSDTSCTNQSDYQLGCSLTNDSVTSQSRSPPQFSPSDQSAYRDDSFEDFDLSTSHHSLRSVDLTPEFKGRYRHIFRRVGRSFFPAGIYQSIESCFSDEVEATQSGPHFGSLFGGPLASSHCLGQRLSSSTGRVGSELSSSSSSHQTMESVGLRSHDKKQVKLENRLKEAFKLKKNVANLLAKANGPSGSELSQTCERNQNREREESTAKRLTTDERNLDCRDDNFDENLRLGTNVKTCLQQQGVKIQHELVLRQSPINCLAENSLAGNETAAAQPSMKAAKDIAKLSIPSLASLQYLPGQVDVRGSRSIDRFVSNKKSRETKDIRLAGVRRSNSMTQQISASATSALSSEQGESDSIKHHNSCLLHRLCLCNCLARGHNNARKVKDGNDSGEARETSTPSPASSSKSSSSRSRRLLKEDKRAQTQASTALPSDTSFSSSEASSSDVRKRANSHLDVATVLKPTEMTSSQKTLRRRNESKQREREKQSPSFMSLLKPDQTRISQKHANVSKSEKHQVPRIVQQRAEQSLEGQQRRIISPATISSDGLGSIDELAVSGRSSASDSRTSEHSPSVGYKSHSPRTSCTYGRSAELLSDSRYPEVATKSQMGIEYEPSCPNPFHNKPVPAHKKLLSPKNLFNSSTSSVCECVKTQQAHHEPSFLSRSLSRLSGRRKKSSPRHQSQAIDSKRAQTPPLDSSNISISNNSQTDIYPDSINTFDGINLNHSLPFNINDEILGKNYHRKNSACLQRAPDIVLSQVKFQDVDSDCSYDTTRSLSANQNYRPSSAQSDRNQVHQYNDYLSHRHNSELSFDESDASGSFNQETFSLPGSPRPQIHSRNRSPRLSHSPVPFHSPANQSSRIEDGLMVCSTENFEKHIDNVKDDQVEAQKRLFTAWINHFAPNLIRHDLFVELQDGIKLIGLLAILTNDKQLLNQYERLNRDKQSYIDRIILTPSSRLNHLSNVSIAIDYLRNNLGVKLVNLNPMDIVSGKAKVILGLCWRIILNFQDSKNLVRISDSSSCEMSIREQDECSSDAGDHLNRSAESSELAEATGHNATGNSKEVIVSGENDPISNENDPISGENDPISNENDPISDENDPISDEHSPISDKAQGEFANRHVEEVDSKKVAPNQKKQKTRYGHKSRNSKTKPGKSNTQPAKTSNNFVKGKTIDEDPADLSYSRKLWNKIVRASRMSLPFNVVLLVCLAGICIIPLIQRDACCELNQPPILSDRFTVNQRPT